MASLLQWTRPGGISVVSGCTVASCRTESFLQRTDCRRRPLSTGGGRKGVRWANSQTDPLPGRSDGERRWTVRHWQGFPLRISLTVHQSLVVVSSVFAHMFWSWAQHSAWFSQMVIIKHFPVVIPLRSLRKSRKSTLYCEIKRFAGLVVGCSDNVCASAPRAPGWRVGRTALASTSQAHPRRRNLAKSRLWPKRTCTRVLAAARAQALGPAKTAGRISFSSF